MREFDAALLLDVYAAATRPAAWTAVVDRLADTVEAAGCMLFLTEVDDPAPWTVAAGSALWRTLPPDVVPHYERHLAHHEAPAFAALRELPERRFVATSDPDPRFHCPADRADAVFLLERAGVQHRAAARLNANAAWHDSLAFQFAPMRGPAPRDRLERARPYLPHLAKTLELGRLYGRLHRVHAAVLAALDHVRVGMAVVSAAGELIVVNAAAQRLLDAGEGVRVDAAGRLAARDPDVHRGLRASCEALSRTAAGAPGVAVRQLAVPLPGARLPLLLEVTPLRDGLDEMGGALTAVMVMMIDPGADGHVDTSGLARVCGLTAAEADVCRWLVRGLATRAIAERRSTGPDTVKSQIAQVYRKTRVDGRTALVRLAVRMQPPVGPTDPPA